MGILIIETKCAIWIIVCSTSFFASDNDKPTSDKSLLIDFSVFPPLHVASIAFEGFADDCGLGDEDHDVGYMYLYMESVEDAGKKMRFTSKIQRENKA